MTKWEVWPGPTSPVCPIWGLSLRIHGQVLYVTRLERLKFTKNYFRVVEQFSLLSVSPIREEQWPLLNLKQSAPHCRRSAVSLWTIFVKILTEDLVAPHFLLSIVECWKLSSCRVPRAISIKSCKSISMPILAIPESRTLPIQAFQTTSRETLFK